MRYNYSICYSDGTTESNVYPLTEKFVYYAMGKAIAEYLRYHKNATVVEAKVEAV